MDSMNTDGQRACNTCLHNPVPRKGLDDIPSACWNCTSSEAYGGPVLPGWKPLMFYAPSAIAAVISEKPKQALAVQVGGGHYKDLVIQPVEYCHKNKLGPCETAVVKYITRWKAKGGKQDLEKAKHFIDLLMELEGL